MTEPQPPLRCTRCPHWENFPVDGKCCTDLDVILARVAHGLALRKAQTVNDPGPLPPLPAMAVYNKNDISAVAAPNGKALELDVAAFLKDDKALEGGVPWFADDCADPSVFEGDDFGSEHPIGCTCPKCVDEAFMAGAVWTDEQIERMAHARAVRKPVLYGVDHGRPGGDESIWWSCNPNGTLVFMSEREARQRGIPPQEREDRIRAIAKRMKLPVDTAVYPDGSLHPRITAEDIVNTAYRGLSATATIVADDPEGDNDLEGDTDPLTREETVRAHVIAALECCVTPYSQEQVDMVVQSILAMGIIPLTPLVNP